MLRLPESHRHLFRSPFGTLVPDIADLADTLQGRRIYTVGDVVTGNVLSMGIIPDVAVIDGHTMRSPCGRAPEVFPRVFHARNPPGTITEMLVEALAKAVACPPALVFVDGEEDLAVIPLVLVAPEGGLILYGQPSQGVVVREIDEEARGTAKSLLGCFIEESGG
ncbi:MAG TPA: GTP-dependent dephospho-CoA kinase family protein [Methanolinea sp.]|nr:GTP-dependent dephospho-CoA kinase family protein [Methanolinea sp.]HQK56582.1 GTP-dependent dephospho-CoA kinase family protein [Methanolinea sp.]